MATRIWFSGAEWGNAAMEFSSVFDSDFAASTSDKKTGSYAFRTEGRSYATVDLRTQYNADYTVPESITQIRVGFWCKQPGALSGTTPRLITVRGASSAEGIIIRWDVSNSEFECYSAQGGSLLDSAVSSAFAAGGWTHILLDTKIDNANGWIYLYVNGTEVLNYTGDTTAGGAGISDCQQVLFGGVQSVDNNWNQYLYFDDIYIDDTSGNIAPAFEPRYQFLLATPDGDGISSDWIGSDGNYTDNYLLVDDVPSDEGVTYLQTNGLQRNTVTLTNPSVTGYGGIVVYPHAIAKNGGASSSEVAIYRRDAATSNVGTSLNMPIGDNYQLVFDELRKSFGGADWTQSLINNLEVGIETL